MDFHRENERFLPIANINRIMKRSLPQNAKISKDAKQTVQECVTEFIFFITSEACERCKEEKRKTISGEDLLYAIQNLGFDEYYEPLKLYLKNYRQWSESTENRQRPSNDNIGRVEGEGEGEGTGDNFNLQPYNHDTMQDKPLKHSEQQQQHQEEEEEEIDEEEEEEEEEQFKYNSHPPIGEDEEEEEQHYIDIIQNEKKITSQPN